MYNVDRMAKIQVTARLGHTPCPVHTVGDLGHGVCVHIVSKSQPLTGYSY